MELGFVIVLVRCGMCIKCPRCDCRADPWEHDEFSLVCTSDVCGEIIQLCVICKMIVKDPNSDICGHASCVVKKAEQMFK